LKHLPVVSLEDEKSGLERFAILLGNKIINKDGAVHLDIKGVYQETKDDEEYSYIEEVNNIYFNLAHTRRIVERLQRKDPALKDFNFLGDIHTHPNSIAKPSDADLFSVIYAYEDGVVNINEPYIFGVGARHPNGEMEYWFYRIVKTESKSGYGYKVLDE
jgi:proteasome lid subunit RPN8/RPN11